MTIYSTVTDVGSMGDRKYAYGTYRQSGVGMAGYILVPMGRVDFIQLQDIGGNCIVSGAVVSGIGTQYSSVFTRIAAGTTFPYSSGTTTTQMTRNNIPVVACVSGIQGIWFAFGKRG